MFGRVKAIIRAGKRQFKRVALADLGYADADGDVYGGIHTSMGVS